MKKDMERKAIASFLSRAILKSKTRGGLKKTLSGFDL